MPTIVSAWYESRKAMMDIEYIMFAVMGLVISGGVYLLLHTWVTILFHDIVIAAMWLVCALGVALVAYKAKLAYDVIRFREEVSK